MRRSSPVLSRAVYGFYFVVFFLGRFSPCKTRTYTALRLIDATPTLSRHLRRSPRCGSARCASSGPLQHGVPFRQTAPPAEKKHFPLAQFFLFFFSVPMRDIRQRTMVKIAGMVTLEMATSIGIGFGGFQMPPSGRRGSCAVLWCSAVVLCWGSALCIVVLWCLSPPCPVCVPVHVHPVLTLSALRRLRCCCDFSSDLCIIVQPPPCRLLLCSLCSACCTSAVLRSQITIPHHTPHFGIAAASCRNTI